MGQTAVIKGQVLTGGRGKAGAVRVVASVVEAERAAREILQLTVKGIPVQRLLVSEKVEIRREYYAAVTIDRDIKSVVLIFSDAGGVDIEETAARTPRKVRQLILTGTESCGEEELKQWLSASIDDAALLTQAVSICQSMYQLFRDKDCTLVEINPLAVCSAPVKRQELSPFSRGSTRGAGEGVEGKGSGQFVALDAKIVLDDSGLMRHPELEQYRNAEEYTPDELEARKAGLTFVPFAGQTGCMVNGAGLAMATMDCIKLAGGSPANFLDVGGSSSPQKIINGLRILQRNPDIKSILINIFGGITRCDDVAEGILTARKTLNLTIPLVIRLIGTNQEKGRDMLQRAGIVAFSDMNEAVQEAVRLARKGGAA
jgi:succinyl-CoA synthetase beta subunit